MKIKYFRDSDTLLIEFSDVSAVETKEIGEDLYVDVDKEGNIVSMTIEHAMARGGISEISFLEMDRAGIK